MAEENIKTVGIDFGTTNTLVAFFNDYGQIDFLKDDQTWNNEIPTLICCKKINSDGKPIYHFGGLAKEKSKIKPESLIQGIKTGLGTNPITEFSVTPLSMDASPFTISAEEAAEAYFDWLYNRLREELSCDTIQAVITYPVAFSSVQCEAIKRAAGKGGFTNVTLYQEPVATSIAYGLENNEPCNILVYDFGGGTIDVAVVRKEGYGGFTVLGTAGAKFGGMKITEDFRNLIYDRLEKTDYIQKMAQQQNSNGSPVKLNNGLSMWSLEDSYLSPDEFEENRFLITEIAEDVKCKLSTPETKFLKFHLTDLHFRDRDKNNLPSITIEDEIHKNQFPLEADSRIKDTKNLIIEAVRSAKIDLQDIDVVIMSGGSSNLPQSKKILDDIFKITPRCDAPGTMIAKGALMLAKGDIQITQIMTTDLGLQASDYWDFDCLIPRGTELPCTTQRSYYLDPRNPGYVTLDLYSRSYGNDAEEVFYCDFEDQVEIQLPKDRINLCDLDNQIIVTLEVTSENEISLNAEVRNAKGEIIVRKNDIKIQRESKSNG